MRRTLVARLIVTPFLVLGAWSVTRAFLAHQPSRPVRRQDVGWGYKRVLDQVPKSTRTTPRPVSKKLEVFNFLEEFSVQAVGNIAVVHGAVSMTDRHPGLVHFWRVKVTDLDSGEVVLNFPYLDQQFPVAESGSMMARFDDQIPLLPGRYTVLLSLHNKYDRYTLEQILEDRNVGIETTVIHVFKKITIL